MSSLSIDYRCVNKRREISIREHIRMICHYMTETEIDIVKRIVKYVRFEKHIEN